MDGRSIHFVSQFEASESEEMLASYDLTSLESLQWSPSPSDNHDLSIVTSPSSMLPINMPDQSTDAKTNGNGGVDTVAVAAPAAVVAAKRNLAARLLAVTTPRLPIPAITVPNFVSMPPGL
jgi:hypothetical protein